jgi:hypothetical protein
MLDPANFNDPDVARAVIADRTKRFARQLYPSMN